MSIAVRVPGPELARRWEDLRAQQPKLRPREAAAALGVSEAELVASGAGDRALRLRPEWPSVLTGLESVGTVTVITRNDSCVHEKTGEWRDVEVTPQHALVLGDAIDLRLFPRTWRHAFALRIEGPRDLRRSLQVFDAAGRAVIKLFVGPGGDVEAFDALVATLAHPDQLPDQRVEPDAGPEIERPDDALDVAGFRAAWRALQDTHDFFPLLRKFGLGRVQALRLAEPDLAWPAAPRAFRDILGEAAARDLPIMIFVGNPGAIQIHTGPVKTLKDVGPWFNVLDPDFNLHLLESDVAHAWAVRKPTIDGIVSSLELFDAARRPILQLFGKRKPGVPELAEWRGLLERWAPPPAPLETT
jgi:putative hemin transport protein